MTSTFGTGGPPDNGSDFWSRIVSDAELRLPGLRYAVFGVGDRAYDDFCGHAKVLDSRLAELGADRVLPLVVSERDEEQLAQDWLRNVVTALRAPRPEGPPARVAVVEPAPAEEERSQDSAGPRGISAPLCLNQVISGENSEKEVRRFGFDVSGSGFVYEAGDALGVHPANAPEDVAAWLAATGMDGERTVHVDGADRKPRRSPRGAVRHL